MGSTLWENGIENGSYVKAKCVMRRSVGLPGNVATSVMLHVTTLVPAIHPWVLWRGSHCELWAGQVLPRNFGNWLPPGAGVGPGSAGSDAG